MRRSLARGPEGERLSLLTGKETEADIRRLMVEIVLDFQDADHCPFCQAHRQCPFNALAGLSYHSLKDLTDTLPIEDCRKVFEMELACRSSQPGNPDQPG